MPGSVPDLSCHRLPLEIGVLRLSQGSPPPSTPSPEIWEACGRRHSALARLGASDKDNWPVGEEETAATHTLNRVRF